MGRIVKKAWGETRIGEKRKLELAELSKKPDSEIDYSDIPPLTEEFFKNAAAGGFYKPVKKQVTLRIDADVLEWLRRKGAQGYQSRLNAVLRDAMLEEIAPKKKRA
jgi:uncharacterized protein (DUF4415 family)